MGAIVLVLIGLIPFYLLGCFPCGALVARRHGVDISAQGSGNVGATNVSRILGKKAGAVTLAGDVAKGALAVFLADVFTTGDSFPALAGLAAVCGHCFPLPIETHGLKLKGGKGVATALGALLTLDPISALLGVGVFLISIWRFRIVSLASVSAALLIPIFAMLLDGSSAVVFTMAMISLVVVWRHRENLERLARGQEKKMTFGKP